MTPEPLCFACEFDGLGTPCRSGGRFDPDRLARAYLSDVVGRPPEEAVEHWAHDCMAEVIETRPDDALDSIIACLAAMKTPDQAAVIAAGPLEDLISGHGASVIGRIEALAQASARFRYVLSGVWSQGHDTSPVWARVLAARAAGPSMDTGAALPDRD